MKYYKERNGLLEPSDFIDEKKLAHYWIEIYKYFNNKGYFKLAETGVKQGNHVYAPQFAPSPAQYFLLHLGKNDMWPIEENIKKYTVEDIFTTIEIYYAEIADCKWEENDDGDWNWTIETEAPKREYAFYINNILKLYKTGYCLEPLQGIIMSTPNDALRHQLGEAQPEIPSAIYERLSSASKDFYRFDATEERKRKAIASLADVLESIRNDMKLIFNSEYKITKNEHDRLIFDVVNNYHIRHDNEKQYENYSTDIWYDWMMQYYTSTIIAFYRLKEKCEQMKREEEF